MLDRPFDEGGDDDPKGFERAHKTDAAQQLHDKGDPIEDFFDFALEGGGFGLIGAGWDAWFRFVGHGAGSKRHFI